MYGLFWERCFSQGKKLDININLLKKFEITKLDFDPSCDSLDLFERFGAANNETFDNIVL